MAEPERGTRDCSQLSAAPSALNAAFPPEDCIITPSFFPTQAASSSLE